MSAAHHDAGLRRALLAGIFANLGVAVAKLVAFAMTHSAAMLAEGLHSVADSSNQLLLLVGLKRSRRAADESHPFGYASERYFWSFVVSINIFLLGALFAIYEGIEKIRHPHPMQNVEWSYAALGLGMVFEGFALRVAWKEFQPWRRSRQGSLWKMLRQAKDLSLPTVLFEDTAALLGLIIAIAGISAAQITGHGAYDGIASVLIGLVLLVVAWFLATESHSLLIGEAASAENRKSIRAAVESDPAVRRLHELKTLHQGPGHLLVALVLQFREDLATAAIEEAVVRIEKRIQQEVPAARDVFIEAGAFGPDRGAPQAE